VRGVALTRVCFLTRKPASSNLRSSAGERERDRLTSIEEVYGGECDDVLRGTNGRNLLDGGPRDDALIDRRGNDILSGGGNDLLGGDAGPDDLDGGRGADRLFARDRAIDGVNGDPGPRPRLRRPERPRRRGRTRQVG